MPILIVIPISLKISQLNIVINIAIIGQGKFKRYIYRELIQVNA